MKHVLLLFIFFYSVHAKFSRPNICRNCFGKIHTREELELTKQSLIIDKNETCLYENFKFLIIVKSGNFQRRNFTRHTWAKELVEHFNIPVLYAVGYPKNSSAEEDIVLEDQLHHDLLQFPIIESYYNLTLKSISVLHWYTEHCSNSSQYLLYVDDDILIHVDRLIMYMTANRNTNAIEGWFETLGKVQRTGIGGISKENFPIDIVPDYLWGAAVLYPSNITSDVLIKSIYNTTLPIFFRDDVFINGFVAEEARISRQHLKGILLYDETENHLKTNMIIIYFKNEEQRIRAWNCYRHNVQCHEKHHFLLLLQILFPVSLILIICWRCCKSMSLYRQLKYKFTLWYYGRNYPYKNSINARLINNKGEQRSDVGRISIIQWLISWRRVGMRIVFIAVLIIVFYFFINYI